VMRSCTGGLRVHITQNQKKEYIASPGYSVLYILPEVFCRSARTRASLDMKDEGDNKYVPGSAIPDGGFHGCLALTWAHGLPFDGVCGEHGVELTVPR